MLTLHVFSFKFSPDSKVKDRRGFWDVQVSSMAQVGEKLPFLWQLSYGSEAMPI